MQEQPAESPTVIRHRCVKEAMADPELMLTWVEAQADGALIGTGGYATSCPINVYLSHACDLRGHLVNAFAILWHERPDGRLTSEIPADGRAVRVSISIPSWAQKFIYRVDTQFNRRRVGKAAAIDILKWIIEDM